MGNPRGDHHQIALRQMMNFSSLDVSSNPLAGGSHFASYHLTSRDEWRFAIDNVEDVSLLSVEFNVTGSRAVKA